MTSGRSVGTGDQELAAVRSIFNKRSADRAQVEAPGSAVLAPFVPTPRGLCLLFERRPEGPERFAGHLSFPGGRIEDDDASPLAAALRESEEEIGFKPSDVEVLGHLVDTQDPRGRPVSAFGGLVAADALPREAASPAEVAEMILVPVADLLQPKASARGDGAWPLHAYRAVSYEARTLPSHEHIVQYWGLKSVAGVRDATLWGFTAGLVAAMLYRAFAWQPPVPPRIVAQWEEFLP